MQFHELDSDQRRESVNSRQRFEAWKSAKSEAERFKGSMVWIAAHGAQYLARALTVPTPGCADKHPLDLDPLRPNN